jgi:probable rRNA maturation factor
MEIVIKDLQKKIALNPPQILKIIKAILRHEGVDQAFLSIVFVNQQRIKNFNKKYLNRAYATDVLAFDLTDNGPQRRKSRRNRKNIIGDIIISTDAAFKNAKSYQTTLSEELALYMIHGILHLLGFDDHKPNDRRKMRKREGELLEHLRAKMKGILK